MAKRRITWLLAALLTLSAAAASPPVRVFEEGPGYSIVWIASERAERQQQREFQPPLTPIVEHKLTLRNQNPCATRLLAGSLYQRPPPRSR